MQAFGGALSRLDSSAQALPSDDWHPAAARGLALAGLGREEEAKAAGDVRYDPPRPVPLR